MVTRRHGDRVWGSSASFPEQDPIGVITESSPVCV